MFRWITWRGRALIAAVAGALPALAQPANDSCFNAIPVVAGSYSGTTIGATNDGGEGTCGASSSAPDVWYSYVAPFEGQMRVSTCGGADWDTVLGVSIGCPGSGWELACNDNSCGLQSTVNKAMVAGMQYMIRVAGHNGATGAFTITITETADACYDWPPCAEAQATCDPPGALITIYGVWHDTCTLEPTGHTVIPGRIDVMLVPYDACGPCGDAPTEYWVAESVEAPPGDYDVYVVGGTLPCDNWDPPPQLVGSIQIACGGGCPGDIDGDQSVGLSDLTILLSNFGTPSGATPSQGDQNGDGDVDLDDLTTFLSRFGSTCP